MRSSVAGSRRFAKSLSWPISLALPAASGGGRARSSEPDDIVKPFQPPAVGSTVPLGSANEGLKVAIRIIAVVIGIRMLTSILWLFSLNGGNLRTRLRRD